MINFVYSFFFLYFQSYKTNARNDRDFSGDAIKDKYYCLKYNTLTPNSSNKAKDYFPSKYLMQVSLRLRTSISL